MAFSCKQKSSYNEAGTFFRGVLRWNEFEYFSLHRLLMLIAFPNILLIVFLIVLNISLFYNYQSLSCFLRATTRKKKKNLFRGFSTPQHHFSSGMEIKPTASKKKKKKRQSTKTIPCQQWTAGNRQQY